MVLHLFGLKFDYRRICLSSELGIEAKWFWFSIRGGGGERKESQDIKKACKLVEAHEGNRQIAFIFTGYSYDYYYYMESARYDCRNEFTRCLTLFGSC